MKSLYNKSIESMLLWPLAILLIVIPFTMDSFVNVIDGLVKICTSGSNLYTDYVYVGNLSSTFLNVGLILLLNLVLMKIFKAKMNHIYYAACVFVLGFSFFGNNIFNVIPFYVGTIVYALVSDIKVKDVLFIGIFATGLSPFVSLMFHVESSNIIHLFLYYLLGAFIGFISPMLSVQSPKFHHGLQLYNMGFTCGVMAFIIYPMLGFFKAPLIKAPIYLLNQNSFNSMMLLIFLVAVSLVYVIIGLTKSSVKELITLTTTNNVGSNYVDKYGIHTSMLNIGVMGLMCAVVVLIFGINLNGPIIGSIICVLSFSPVGKNLYNTIPVMSGVVIGALLLGYSINNDASNITIITAMFFVTGIAPITSKYGVIAGLIAGVFHVGLVVRTGATGGFMNLYNNGFAGGFVAFLFGSFYESFKLRKFKLNK